MNGRERKDELVKRAELLNELAIISKRPELAGSLDLEQLFRELIAIIRDMADLIANPPCCCDPGPQGVHIIGCTELP